MVDPTILQYIDRYRNQYPLFELKKRVLSSGHSESEFNEALEILGVPNASPKEANRKRDKLMIISGIIGLILLIAVLSLTIKTGLILKEGAFSEYTSSLNSENLKSNNLSFTGIILLIAVVLTLIIFYFGFIRMGNHSETKTLKISSWLIVILIILASLATIGLAIWQSNNQSNGNISDSTENNTITINPWIFVSIISIITIIVLSFGVGLILARKKVKFTNAAGIFHILVVLLLIFTIGKFFYQMNTDEEFAVSFVFSSLMDSTGKAIFNVL
jgi:hypothetical protein